MSPVSVLYRRKVHELNSYAVRWHCGLVMFGRCPIQTVDAEVMTSNDHVQPDAPILLDHSARTYQRFVRQLLEAIL